MPLVRLPGSARRYRNSETGEILSRRQAQLAPKAHEAGFPSSSAMQAVRRYEREHPAPAGWKPQPMQTLVRGALPGEWQEAFLTPRSFRDASLIAKHRVAVADYLGGKGDRGLRRFARMNIYTREAGTVQLLIARGTIRELGESQEFDFGDIYEAP